MKVQWQVIGRMIIKLVFDYKNQIELHPIRSLVFLVLSHFGFFALGIWGMSFFGESRNSFAHVFMWVWLFWMIYLGVPTVRFLGRRPINQNVIQDMKQGGFHVWDILVNGRTIQQNQATIAEQAARRGTIR